MEIDEELLEAFVEEVAALKLELQPIFAELQNNKNQPELYLNFAQIIDRIYGTATTMGFEDLGSYLGMVRNMSRKCGHSKIQRAQPVICRILENCLSYFDELNEAFKNPSKTTEFMKKINLDIKKAEMVDREVFAFSKEATVELKK